MPKLGLIDTAKFLLTLLPCNYKQFSPKRQLFIVRGDMLYNGSLLPVITGLHNCVDSVQCVTTSLINNSVMIHLTQYQLINFHSPPRENQII